MSSAITVRFPEDLYRRLKAEAEQRQTSINQMVAEAVQEYLAAKDRAQAITELKKHQLRMQEKYGVGADSTPILRQLREEN